MANPLFDDNGLPSRLAPNPDPVADTYEKSVADDDAHVLIDPSNPTVVHGPFASRQDAELAKSAQPLDGLVVAKRVPLK
jgi:hypothetical protein